MICKIAIFFIGSFLITQSFSSEISFDNFGRLISYPGKIEVACPKQNKDTAVLLVIGQSNAANHAEKQFTTQYPSKVFAYFNGKCFIAASPLLGASGNAGEFITPLADKLIANGDYGSVLIVPLAIGGSTINRWHKGGDLNVMMQAVLSGLSPRFKVTEVIWHQGESDFAEKTTAKEYQQCFNSLLETVRHKGDVMPPVFYAVATLCGHNPEWTPNNSLASGQRSLANPKQKIYLGADTDRFLLSEDRDVGYCHLSEKGQLKAAAAFAEAIHKYKNKLDNVR
ncbi:MAG: hypothetical protein H0U73_10610 [Tatlockia sp.]|nr:hypothetical protein [Tatlockia sp.]